MDARDEILVRREMMGTLLARARQSAGLTLETCAHVLEVQPADVEAYEAGEADLTLPQLEILSRMLGVPVTYFWSESASLEAWQSPLPTSALLGIRRRMIGVQIRQARLAAGKSLAQCAERLNTTTDVLAAYEYGRSDIPFRELEILAAFLHVPLSYFADEDLLPNSEKDQQMLDMIAQLPPDVRDFVLKPANTLYVRLAMLLSGMSTETLRQLGEGLLDITL
jgi:transcriptional regulator with XRE-family HTH domain